MNAIVMAVCGVMLSVGAVMALIRVVRGPSMLDRVVAADIMVATVFGAVALNAGWRQETFTMPVLVALAAVGFIGSVSVARFAASDAQQPENEENFNLHVDEPSSSAFGDDSELLRKANVKVDREDSS